MCVVIKVVQYWYEWFLNMHRPILRKFEMHYGNREWYWYLFSFHVSVRDGSWWDGEGILKSKTRVWTNNIRCPLNVTLFRIRKTYVWNMKFHWQVYSVANEITISLSENQEPYKAFMNKTRNKLHNQEFNFTQNLLHDMFTSGSFPGVKQPESETDHSPPPGTEVKNAWCYMYTPP
jgi:hypothetical protein